MNRTKTLTRARAERQVATTNDPAKLEQLSAHQNKHVKNKALRKLKSVQGEAS